MISLIAGIPIALLAFSTGPPVRRTGAAVDGGLSCTACHVSFAPANSDPAGSVTLQFDTPTYTPGVTQTVHVTVSHPLALRWGFQLSARPVNNQTHEAGTFTPTSVVRVRCDTTPAQDAPCNGALEFAEHLSAPRTAAGVGYTFDVPWTPPATDVGDVIFYFAGNAANGDGTDLGDRIYTSSRAISSVNACSTAPAAKPTIGAMVNGASGLTPWSSNSILSIFGANFAAAGFTRGVAQADFVNGAFPQQLGCVAVEINGARVPISYVQGNQINLQAPTLTQTGPATVAVVVNPGTAAESRSALVNLTSLQSYSPAFFTFNGTTVAAVALSGLPVANPSVVATGLPAKPGDIISVYGTGFGPATSPVAAGVIATTADTVAAAYSVLVNGVTLAPADVLYAGLSPGSLCGLYQVNLRVPIGTPDGNIPIAISIGGVTSPPGITLPVKSGQ